MLQSIMTTTLELRIRVNLRKRLPPSDAQTLIQPQDTRRCTYDLVASDAPYHNAPGNAPDATKICHSVQRTAEVRADTRPRSSSSIDRMKTCPTTHPAESGPCPQRRIRASSSARLWLDS